MIEVSFKYGINSIITTGLVQWDYGQKLRIKGLSVPPTLEVHFSNDAEREAIVMVATLEDSDIICDIPNVLLEKSLDIRAWVYVIGENSGETIKEIMMKVEPRIKPQDFISVNPDAQDLLAAVLNKINENIDSNDQFIEDLKQKIESGYFDGEDGHTPVITVQDGYWYVDDINTGQKAQGGKGDKGDKGESAYEVAVSNGFQGAEEEWLESLKYQHSEEFNQLAEQVKEDSETSSQAVKTVTQINSDIENQANAFDTNCQEKTKAFNDNANAKTEAFNQAVEGANTVIDEKVQEATKQANKAQEEADRATQATDGKLDKNQGVENSGKVLGIGEDGNVVPVKGGSKLVGEVLLAEYVHQGNQEIHFSEFDWSTAIGTTTEPHGLTEATPVQVVPNGWFDNFEGNSSNIKIKMCSVPIEWMMYNHAIYLLPLDEIRVKIVQNDKQTAITVNPDDTSNALINFMNFHFEIPIGVDINNITKEITPKKIKVKIFGLGGFPKAQRYLLFDNGYYIAIAGNIPGLSLFSNIYNNFIYCIEIFIDYSLTIKPICEYTITYISQRKGYGTMFVGDPSQYKSYQYMNYTGSSYTFNRFRNLDQYAFLTNGTNVKIYALEGEYNEG